MRRVLLSAALVLLTTAAAAQPPPTGVARVEAWLKAVLAHEPGTLDDAAEKVAEWPTSSVRKLWVDVSNLVALMRNPRIRRFDIRPPGQRTGQTIRYDASEFRRLKVLACVAGGSLREMECSGINTTRELDADLRRLAQFAEDAKRQGDDNYIL